MQLGTFLEVGISLAVMYAMLGLMCTTANELLATFLKFRSNNLKGAILQLIDNQQLYRSFYNHGIIKSELEMTAKQPVRTRQPDSSQLQNAVPNPANDPGDAKKPVGKDAPGKHTSYIDSNTFALALLDSLDTSKPITTVQEALDIANKLPQSNVRDIMLNALNDAGHDLQKARDSIAIWFDGTMDRLTGQYKRDMQKVTLLLGLLLAILLNADSFAVTRELWRNSTIRTEVVQKAANLPANEITKTCANEPENQQETCGIKLLNKRLADLAPLPLGWDLNAITADSGGLLFLLLKIPGLLVTALAISLGAPFWFDLLQKFIDIRGTGKKPEPKEKG
ncbi:hypothetical protein [Rhizobium mongolense]|uniref:Tight adherence protein B n=2 Tax=Rhizobium mongolense TaxID=57676 RepID=A0ABR6IN75_9HYPH|nr:hypothetical protein [Rhizobium mongolense]MBB4229334.1 hypothetical protein [Rhizobium mongolense]TVZ63120.1 hypothetical protein BCL32_3241 [Rhizobium mongolense USDA 1844]